MEHLAIVNHHDQEEAHEDPQHFRTGSKKAKTLIEDRTPSPISTVATRQHLRQFCQPSEETSKTKHLHLDHLDKCFGDMPIYFEIADRGFAQSLQIYIRKHRKH